MTEILRSVRWGQALLWALVVQPVLIATLYAMGAFTSGWDWTRYDQALTRGACFLIPFLAGLWVARRAKGHFTANGVAVGLLAALFFLPVLIAAPPPFPMMEAINGALKVLGGALGGGLVGHKTRRRARRRA